MTTAMSLCLLFLAKMADNALSTVKTIMIQEKPESAGGRSNCAFQFSLFLDYAQRGVGRQPADNADGSGGQWCWLLFWSAASITSYPRIAPMSMW